MAYLEYTEPNVCIDENLTTDDAGLLRFQPWSIPRPVVDVKVLANDGDGKVYPTEALPGKMLINQQVGWRNDTPIEQGILVRVTRGSKHWITSQPNAIQFRDRWSNAVDATPEPPVTSDIYDSIAGTAVDVGTNSVAEPNPGVQHVWVDAFATDRWEGPILPGERFNLWYRMYLWTPPPWSDNANKNNPQHFAWGNWARIELWAYPTQGTLVSG